MRLETDGHTLATIESNRGSNYAGILWEIVQDLRRLRNAAVYTQGWQTGHEHRHQAKPIPPQPTSAVEGGGQRTVPPVNVDDDVIYGNGLLYPKDSHNPGAAYNTLTPAQARMLCKRITDLEAAIRQHRTTIEGEDGECVADKVLWKMIEHDEPLGGFILGD